MSNIIVSWAVMRGLSGLEAAFRDAIGEETFESAMRNQLDIIEKKLDSIIGAPFRQALMYLREGNHDRSKEKLIEAMSLNELDLPAATLYCSLITPTNKVLALEYYEDIARKFGAHRNIVPEVLLSWLEQYIAEGSFLAGVSGFEVYPNDGDHYYYPTAVFCSAWNIVAKWEFKVPGMDNHKPRLIAYDWRGAKLLDVQENRFSIVAITGNYIAVDTGKDGIRIWDLLRGVRLPDRLSSSDARKLFVTDRPVVIDTGLQWPEQIIYRLGNTIIQIDQHQYQREEWVVENGGWISRARKTWVTKSSGKLVVKRTALETASPSPLLTTS